MLELEAQPRHFIVIDDSDDETMPTQRRKPPQLQRGGEEELGLPDNYFDLTGDTIEDTNILDLTMLNNTPNDPVDNETLNVSRTSFADEICKDDRMNVDSSSETPSTLAQDLTMLYSTFQAKVLDVFPDICHDYIRTKFDAHCQGDMRPVNVDHVSQNVIMEILESDKYPKQSCKSKNKKRKHSSTEDDRNEERKWIAPFRRPPTGREVLQIRGALLSEFPMVPFNFINEQIKVHKNLWPAYRAVAAAVRISPAIDPPFKRLKRNREVSICKIEGYDELQLELEAARKKRLEEETLEAELTMAAELDAALEQKALEEGDIVECQCCFSDIPSARSTHCSNDTCHFFCLDCAKGAAKAQIEQQRYKLPCMDGSGCQAEFSHLQRLRFLDPKSQVILDRLQQQSELRDANIEGLEDCPRCDYAEIYPPVEVNRIFECKNEDCDAVTICRLCRNDSHVPNTCAEYQKKLGLAERNAVAEAMTEALIRKCPKCSVAIIKEAGCNKMTCTKCGCYFCDVCKKDITKETYNHFKPGGCPQVDDHDARDQQKIDEASKAAKAKGLAENPGLSEEDLEIKFSEAISSKPEPPYLLAGNADPGNRHLLEVHARHEILRGRHRAIFLQQLAHRRHIEEVYRRRDEIHRQYGEGPIQHGGFQRGPEVRLGFQRGPEARLGRMRDLMQRQQAERLAEQQGHQEHNRNGPVIEGGLFDPAVPDLQDQIRTMQRHIDAMRMEPMEHERQNLEAHQMLTQENLRAHLTTQERNRLLALREAAPAGRRHAPPSRAEPTPNALPDDGRDPMRLPHDRDEVGRLPGLRQKRDYEPNVAPGAPPAHANLPGLPRTVHAFNDHRLPHLRRMHAQDNLFLGLQNYDPVRLPDQEGQLLGEIPQLNQQLDADPEAFMPHLVGREPRDRAGRT